MGAMFSVDECYSSLLGSSQRANGHARHVHACAVTSRRNRESCVFYVDCASQQYGRLFSVWSASGIPPRVFCRSVSRLYKEASLKAQRSSKLEACRRVQEFNLWRLNVWFEDFTYAVVQWYLECGGYSSFVKTRCQETDSENIVKEQPFLRAVTKTGDSRLIRSSVECFVVWKSAIVL
jgi:hypothetical protein